MFLALLAVAAFAQPPAHHCETPSVFGALIYHHSHSSGSHQDFSARSQFWQDGERSRVATYDVVNEQNSTQARYHRIMFWHDDVHQPDGGVEFKIDLNAKNCTKYELKGAFRPVGIPVNATYIQQQYVGSAGYRDGSILSNYYKATFAHQYGTSYWDGMYSSGSVGCWPIFETIEDKNSVNTSVTHIQYFNLVQGHLFLLTCAC
jgi:hypothetical protein